jgi:hypothetical protein
VNTRQVENTNHPVEVPSGARFFDGKNRDLGWAARVSKRRPSLGGLTVLDVNTAESMLAMHLRTLDKSKLFVRADGADGQCYSFAWASGYANGNEIRVQGVLEEVSSAHGQFWP